MLTPGSFSSKAMGLKLSECHWSVAPLIFCLTLFERWNWKTQDQDASVQNPVWTVKRCIPGGTFSPVRVVVGSSGLYWAVLGCSGLYWAVLCFSGLYWTVLGRTGLYWAVLHFTVLCLAVLGCTGLYYAVEYFTLPNWLSSPSNKSPYSPICCLPLWKSFLKAFLDAV